MALRFGRLVLAAAAACTLASALSSCAADQAGEAFLSQNNSFIAKTEGCCRPMTQELAGLVKTDPQLKRLLEKSIAAASAVNPDPQTNPAQTLEQYFEYLNWAETAMPWAILPNVSKNHPKLYEQIDQSLNYFYFINDRPLKELENKELYIPSLQYAEPYRSWMIRFVKNYGNYLSQPQSWSEEHLAVARSDARFGLDSGDYEDPSNWKSFNDFFVRRLADPSKRPIAAVNDDKEFAEKYAGLFNEYINPENIDAGGSFPVRFLSWEKLDTLQFTLNYFQGSLPSDDYLKSKGFQNWKDDDKIMDDEGKVILSVADSLKNGDTDFFSTHQIPKVLPRIKSLAINLNRMSGEVPNWILRHPNLDIWDPFVFIFTQEGRDRNGNAAGFSNAPKNLNDYYEVFGNKKYDPDNMVDDDEADDSSEAGTGSTR